MKREENKSKTYNIIDISPLNVEFSYDNPNLIIACPKDTLPITVKKGEHLIIVEWFHSFIEKKVQKREIVVQEGAFLEYVKLSMIPGLESLDINYEIKCHGNSKVKLFWFDLGEGKTRNILKSTLKEENIDISLNSLVNLKGNGETLNSIDIVHDHPNTYSDIRVRYLLDDEAKGEIEAISVINKNALYSKAFQDSKTILLSDDAKIKARPHLEILTDELEASHGAVTGGLDDEAVYYLRSRGISEDSAKKILIDAFCDVPINDIKNVFVKEWIFKLIKND